MHRRLAPLVLASLLLAYPARADVSPQDRAAADALYEESEKLAKAERFREAAEKLEASLRLDPGIGTLLRLGWCYEKLGRTASSWSTYQDAEAMARKAGDARAKEAAARAKQIAPLLSRVVLDVAPENRAAGVEVRRDGKVLEPGAWSSPIPLDPGEHVIEAAGVGRVPWKAIFTVATGAETMTLQVPPLAPAPASPPPIPADGTSHPSSWGAQRIAGLGLVGAALAGLASGAVFGGVAISKKNASNADGHCDAGNTCDPIGLGLRADSIHAGNASTALFIAGGALAAGGLIVFLTAPSKTTMARRAQVRVAAGLGEVRLTTQW